jgi:CrcB protein
MNVWWLWIIVSGGIGSLLRYLLSTYLAQQWLGLSIVGTGAVNVIGCLLFGFLYTLFDHFYVSGNLRAIVLSGFLGGFTTMSAFAGEVVMLFSQNQPLDGVMYIIITNVGVVLAVWLGCISAHLLVK